MMGNSNKIVEALEVTMKLKPFLPIIISGVIFIIFLFLPASWFTGLVTNKTLADNRISLTDQVLKGTLKINYSSQISITRFMVQVNWKRMILSV